MTPTHTPTATATPEPTATPTPEPTAYQVVTGDRLTREDMDALYERVGVPFEWREALMGIAYCESRFRPGAMGDRGNSLGLHQLWSGWFPAAGESLEAWADPETNTRVAVYVRTVRGRFGGQGGWTCADLLGVY